MTTLAFTKYRVRVAFSLVCLTAGCGGEDKGRTSGSVAVVPPVDQCKLAQAYEFRNLVDFEPVDNSPGAVCDPTLAEICKDPTPTPFYFNYDVNHTYPLPEAEAAKETTKCLKEDAFDANLEQGNVTGSPITDSPRCGVSEHALHIKVSNVAECYGPTGRLGWGAGLDLTMKDKLDALGLEGGPYDGISFWVRKGSTATKPSFIFSVVDAENNGIDLVTNGDELPQCGCQFEPKEGEPKRIHCYSDPPASVPDGRKCDAFSAAVTLTDDWTFVAARFSQLRQKGFGAASPLPEVDAAQIKRLQFLMVAGDWDFWIDDLALFKDIP